MGVFVASPIVGFLSLTNERAIYVDYNLFVVVVFTLYKLRCLLPSLHRLSLQPSPPNIFYVSRGQLFLPINADFDSGNCRCPCWLSSLIRATMVEICFLIKFRFGI